MVLASASVRRVLFQVRQVATAFYRYVRNTALGVHNNLVAVILDAH